MHLDLAIPVHQGGNVANREQLEILKQGVESWNRWRQKHREEQIDLSRSDLSQWDLQGVNLVGAKLIWADLSGARLQGASLREANLSEAQLNQADCRGADLTGADLRGASLQGINLSGGYLHGAQLNGVRMQQANLSIADLSEADLSRAELDGSDLSVADLTQAILSGADLDGACLVEATLCEADLSVTTFQGADLSQADLSQAKLHWVNLRGANLCGAKLSRADLREASLAGADLTEADLYQVNLTQADLSQVQALETNLTGATLTGACVEGWIIDADTQLRQVNCEYVYLRSEQQERCPADESQIFEPGEFTKRFQPLQGKLEMIFREGINWQAWGAAFAEVNHQCQEQSRGQPLLIRAIETKGYGILVIHLRFPVDLEAGDIQGSLRQAYSKHLVPIEDIYRRDHSLDTEQLSAFRQQCASIDAILKHLAQWSPSGS